MGVSKNNGTPKSSNLIGFSIINHPFWGTPIFEVVSQISSINLTHSLGRRLLATVVAEDGSGRGFKSTLVANVSSLHPLKLTCPPKRDHFNRNIHLPTIDFQGTS